jgi:hypothetical protein
MIKHDENDYDRYFLNIAQFHFRLNYLRIKPDVKFTNVAAVRGRAFTNFMKERELTFPWFPDPENTVYLEHGGWHWSDFGNDEHVINKLKSFCHIDQNNPTQLDFINIESIIASKRDRNPVDEGQRFEYVVIDDYFPKCITNNLDKWQHMIIPDAQYSVLDFYKEKK